MSPGVSVHAHTAPYRGSVLISVNKNSSANRARSQDFNYPGVSRLRASDTCPSQPTPLSISFDADLIVGSRRINRRSLAYAYR